MKNSIEQYTASDPIVQKLKSIEQQLREYKANQAPSVRLSNTASITFSLQDDFINAGGGFPDLVAIATLTPPTDQTILALPEFNIFWGSHELVEAGDEGDFILPTADRVFPGGARFSDYDALPAWFKALVPDDGRGAIYLSKNWWYDYWDVILDSSQQIAKCRLRIDAALMNGDFPSGQFVADWGGNAFTLTARWRYLLPGAST